MEQITKAKIMKHVYANVTDLVSYILDMKDHGAPLYDAEIENVTYECLGCGSREIEKVKSGTLVNISDNGYECPICGFIHSHPDDAADCCAGDDGMVFTCRSCGAVYADTGEMCDDIILGEQWWIVSPDLYAILKEHKEHTICGRDGNHYWGTDTDVPLQENEILLACLMDL